MNVRLIQVAYHAGDEQAGSSEGPRRLLEAGAEDVLARPGVAVAVQAVERDGPFRDTAVSAADVNGKLAEAVRHAVRANELPIVVAGSCNGALGVLAGFEHADCGAVWLDAHADFNTPESTASGFFPGMSLAVVAGHCYRDYWAQIGDSTPIEEDAIALFGVRDLSPEKERDRLERSSIQVVGWTDGEPDGDIESVLDELRRHVADVYLHVDLDAFAPEVAPGVADEPVPGGLSRDDAEAIIRGTAERFRIRAATLATYTPERDVDDATLELSLGLLSALGEYAASTSGAGAS
jgi:arginase